MKLTVVGCSGSMSGPEAPASCYLLQARGGEDDERLYSVVLDLGAGAMGQLLRYVDPARLDALVFSHLHADHCADIVGMQVYRRWHPEGALPRLAVFSPGDGAARTRGISGDAESETYAGEFGFQQVKPGDTVRIGPMTVELFEAMHTISAVSIRVTGPAEGDPTRQVVFTYTGDTDYTPSVVEAARGADFLLSEAAFEEGRDTVRGVHMTGRRAGQLAAEAGAKKLALTHLQPWTNKETNVRDASDAYRGDVFAVSAGDEYLI